MFVCCNLLYMFFSNLQSSEWIPRCSNFLMMTLGKHVAATFDIVIFDPDVVDFYLILDTCFLYSAIPQKKGTIIWNYIYVYTVKAVHIIYCMSVCMSVCLHVYNTRTSREHLFYPPLLPWSIDNSLLKPHWNYVLSRFCLPKIQIQ